MIDVSLPEEDLLIFDYLGITAFQMFEDEITARNYTRGPVHSIISDNGRINTTTDYWNTGKVVCIDTDHSPTILSTQDPNIPSLIVVGTITDNDLKTYGTLEKSTSVFAQRRNICIVERSQLMRILAGTRTDHPNEHPKMDAKFAEHEILDRIKYNEIKNIKIKPGSYHLYFTGDHKTAPDLFARYDTGIDPMIAPIFALTETPLIRKA